MVRMLFPFSLLSAAVAMQTADIQSHFDIDGMKSAMLSIAASSAKKGGISEAEALAIQGFLNTIEGDLLAALEADKTASQAALDTALAAVNKCNTDRATWEDGTLAGLNAGVTSDLGTHNDCRAQENVTLTNLTNHCNILEQQVCSWNICNVPSFTNGDSDLVEEYICCLDTFFKENKPSYYNKRTACIDATTLHHEQTAVCDGNQETFETNFCDREIEIQTYCDTYNTCRCTTEATFASVKSDTEGLEDIFQTQFVALHHLVCYGNAILANATDLSSCADVGKDCTAEYTDCPTITYVDPDDDITCTEPHQNYPCQDGFKNEFYSQYDNSCTPVADCEPCTDASVHSNSFAAGKDCTLA